ncbi:hypothetical protein [Ureaplasma ceti]|uniref:Uncharacterized protein n=1 Tax=Ureaplasma ceti TaxID=3119530 RepID=A0ABP9U7N0_9BACT
MKTKTKAKKAAIITLSTLLGTAALGGVTYGIFDAVQNISMTRIAKNERANGFVKYDLKQQMQHFQNIADLQKEADINMYYSSYGVQTFFNLVRLAMLAPTETHFFYSSRLYLKTNNFQNALNAPLFQEFLRNGKVVDKTKEADLQKSTVQDLGIYTEAWVVPMFRKIVQANPTKKINIWVNSDHIKDAPRLVELASYPNVHLFGLEDSNIIGDLVADDWGPELKQEFTNPQTQQFNPPKLRHFNRETQYLIPGTYNGIVDFFSSNSDVQKITDLGLKNFYPYFSDASKSLKDLIFQTRDKEHHRLTNLYNQITGINWEEARDIVKHNDELNHRPNLIIIGTGRSSDKDVVLTTIKEYGTKYNIYYKGHPGHNAIENWVKDLKPEATYNFFNPKTQQKDSVTLTDTIVTALNSQIPSEELTTNHVNQPDGLKFQKWVVTDPTSGALLGLNNRYNTFADVLDVYDDGHYVSKDSSEYMNTDIRVNSNIATKYLSYSLVDNQLKVTINNPEIIKTVNDLKLKQTTSDEMIYQAQIEYTYDTEHHFFPIELAVHKTH